MTTALSKYIRVIFPTTKNPRWNTVFFDFIQLKKKKKSNPIIFIFLLISELTNTAKENNVFFSFYNCKLLFGIEFKKIIYIGKWRTGLFISIVLKSSWIFTPLIKGKAPVIRTLQEMVRALIVKKKKKCHLWDLKIKFI